ncbi:hypothetical protein L207DRAFT_528189 [Hyaloscypha variabilis F]|uniref:Uncharacterized protein n=1 Tax=Hyaloscypha variabilis (strain UAMH 11265 / GT02V1 / F) TaxID=1149755 RepID=A0A2J6RSS7_HYAVF|nr:hypothetical protein L207DRAFT_528189 [Hyaloscypha variabilis F]
MDTRAELITRLTPQLRKPVQMPEIQTLNDLDEEMFPPPLLPGEYMEHNNRRLEHPPKPIGYERALKEAGEALQRDLYDDDREDLEARTTTPVPQRRRSSTLRPEAPIFTPTKVTDNNNQVKPVVPHMNSADYFHASNKYVVEESFVVTSGMEEKKVRWEGSDDSGSTTPRGPQTWLGKMEVLAPVESEGRRAPTPRAPQVAVPRYFDAHHLRQ